MPREFILKLREQRLLPPLLILLAVAFAVFANTFGAEWSYDDYPVIVENPDVLSLSNFFANSYAGRPLREVTFLLDHALFGMQPMGWHVQHIFWHGLCAWLVWLLAMRLDFGRTVAWIAALIFLVHPLQVEVVANISHRKESLSLAFSLMALLAYLRGCSEEGRRRLGWLAAAFGLAGVAYLGKQTAVVLVPMFLVCEWAALPRERRVLLRWWKLLLAGAVLAGLAFTGWMLVGGGGESYVNGIKEVLPYRSNWLGEMSFTVYARTVFKSWLFMSAKWLLPVGLAPEYIIAVPDSWFDPWVLGGMALAGAYLAGTVFLARQRSPLFLPAAWIGLIFFPTSNVWPLTYLAADRYMYAPTAGVALLAAVALVKLCSGRQRFVCSVTTLLLAILAGLTFQQNRVWATQESLWLHAAQVNPTSGFVLNNVGNIHYLKNELPQAYEYYSRAVEINPLNPSVQYNMGMIFERTGDTQRALQFYRNFLLLEHPVWYQDREALKAQLRQKYRVRFENGEFVRDVPSGPQG